MKKVLFVVAVAGLFATTSCKKCADCEAYALGTATGETREFCGDELEAAEDSWNEAFESGWKCE